MTHRLLASKWLRVSGLSQTRVGLHRCLLPQAQAYSQMSYAEQKAELRKRVKQGLKGLTADIMTAESERLSECVVH